MNNKKGFTLVELLVVIGVIALIIGVAIPTYISIDRQVKKRNYENKVKSIEFAAEKFSFDTGETILMVDDLVKNGYLDADDENGNIINPKDNSKMNCHIVTSEKQETYYKAKYDDTKSYEVDNKCSIEKYYKENDGIKILVNNEINNSKIWYKGNVSLKAIFYNDEEIDCNIDKCLWTSSSGINKPDNSLLELTDINGVRNNVEYIFTLIKNNDNDLKTYKVTKKISIDNEKPIIYDEKIEDEKDNGHILVKKLVINASDGNGSGISEYCINGNCLKNNTLELLQNGDITIEVKDKVGNSTSKQINISGIEKKINFDTQCNINKNSIYVTNGELYKGLPTKNDMKRTGYEFIGWFTSKDGGQKIENDKTQVNIDKKEQTLYAHWNLLEYSITYNLNGGSISNQKTKYTVEDEFKLLVPTKDKYDFTGWTGSNGTTKQTSVKVSKGTTGNLTYTANWKLSDDVAPSCTLTATTSGITWKTKSDNVGGSGLAEYGLGTSTTPTYNSKNSLTLAVGTYYGYVKDAAGNENSCTLTVEDQSIISYTKTTLTCSRGSCISYGCSSGYDDGYGNCYGSVKYSKVCPTVSNDHWGISYKNVESFEYNGKCIIAVCINNSTSKCKCSISEQYTSYGKVWCYDFWGAPYEEPYYSNYLGGTTCNGYNYEFTSSDSEETSCSIETSFKCTKSRKNDSYVSNCKPNKGCKTGYNSLGNYCYK